MVNTTHVNPTSSSVRGLRAAIHPIHASVIRRITSDPVKTLTSRAAASPIHAASTFARHRPWRVSAIIRRNQRPRPRNQQVRFSPYIFTSGEYEIFLLFEGTPE